MVPPPEVVANRPKSEENTARSCDESTRRCSVNTMKARLYEVLDGVHGVGVDVGSNRTPGRGLFYIAWALG